jgi:hypothetical protein
VTALLQDIWSNEDPYCSLEAPAELLRAEIERGLASAEFGAVAVGARAVCAAVLVHSGGSGASGSELAPSRATLASRGWPPRCSGSSTPRCARGVSELASAASAANTPSLRWHLTRGFDLAEDPVREALRSSNSPRTHGQL